MGSGQDTPKTKQNASEGVYTSTEIFRGRREVIIRHEDKHYRLQITKAGKLILNK